MPHHWKSGQRWPWWRPRRKMMTKSYTLKDTLFSTDFIMQYSLVPGVPCVKIHIIRHVYVVEHDNARLRPCHVTCHHSSCIRDVIPVNIRICKRCSFECDIGKYSTRMNNVWAFRRTPCSLNMCCIFTYRSKNELRLYFLTRSSHAYTRLSYIFIYVFRHTQYMYI